MNRIVHKHRKEIDSSEKANKETNIPMKQHSQTMQWKVMSVSRLMVYKLSSGSPTVEIPPNAVIVDYFKKFGKVEKLIITNTNEGLVEFETDEIVRDILSQKRHELETCAIEINSIPIHSRFRSEPDFQYLLFYICEVQKPKDLFMDRIPQLKRAPIKLFNESGRAGILGYTIFKEAKDALNLSVLFYDKWKFELSSVEEEE
ncbi:hypothetical protein ACTXT7_011717, partial [Hymenolepis weldensis]